MSLTKQDLLAISEMTRDLNESLETRLLARIDDLDDILSLQTEHGLQEVRDDIGSVKEVVSRINRVQQAEVERNDRQGRAVDQIRKSPHAA